MILCNLFLGLIHEEIAKLKVAIRMKEKQRALAKVAGPNAVNDKTLKKKRKAETQENLQSDVQTITDMTAIVANGGSVNDVSAQQPKAWDDGSEEGDTMSQNGDALLAQSALDSNSDMDWDAGSGVASWVSSGVNSVDGEAHAEPHRGRHSYPLLEMEEDYNSTSSFRVSSNGAASRTVSLVAPG